MASIVERLTENIVERNLLREGAALSKKWEKTGLLEGIDNSMTKTTMSRLLENQAKELLREASTMSAGDVEGFAAVAFPIVRRVFGGLIANELVAVQPMSLPSGLIFFLDFTYSNDTDSKAFAGASGGQSVYGGTKVGSQITGGVNIADDFTSSPIPLERSFYSLNNGFSSATGSITAGVSATNAVVPATKTGFTTFGGLTIPASTLDGTLKGNQLTASDAAMAIIGYDPDVLSDSTNYYAAFQGTLGASTFLGRADFDANNLTALDVTALSASNNSNSETGLVTVRRLTKLYQSAAGVTDPTKVVVVVRASSVTNLTTILGQSTAVLKAATFAVKDSYAAGNAIGSVATSLLELEGAGSGSQLAYEANANVTIPEIDIKVDSIAVTAQTKKLKAKWSPELGQDLNAYHNLDAEVELTSILSEHVALEIDQEILNDLVKGATAGTKYWSRRPGKFVNRDTGASITSVGAPPDFTGNVSMWYETLVETINDVSAQIHRKTRRGGANFLVTSPEVANILEFTSGFRADVSMEDLKGGSVGAVKAGSLSKKWDLYVDPYFPRNLILVGRRGKAFLESGYVYAPYVPLMITPTIFGTEDFVPRKGLMTRYAKKMVRPDMYGLVVCQDLIG
jgi:hypothetical protein